MKRFLFAVAVVALSAAVSAAEDKPAVAPTPAPAATPVVVGSAAPVMEYAPAQSTRRGLFGRLRNRNTSTMTTTVVTTPATGAATMPPLAAPMPMPGMKTGTTPMTGTVVPASGSVPAGQYTTTDGTIVPVGATAPMTTETQSTRRGLFSRLRSR